MQSSINGQQQGLKLGSTKAKALEGCVRTRERERESQRAQNSKFLALAEWPAEAR